MGDFEEIQALLDAYSIHPIGADEPPTLMEIAGFPHWENVYSNILAFLLDTQEAHGFEQLFIRSLMAAYRRHCPAGWPMEGLDPESVHATESVEREVRTDSDKRIDILIKCMDCVICIENKIWARLPNDLGDYREHCKKLSNGDPNRVVGIVLSPYRVTDPSLDACHFVSITYGDLVAEVRRHLGGHIGFRNTKYQYLLFDFLEQINRLSRTNTMTDAKRKFLDFWRKNKEKIDNIQSNCDELLDDAKKMAEAHLRQCMEQLTEEGKKSLQDVDLERQDRCLRSCTETRNRRLRFTL